MCCVEEYHHFFFINIIIIINDIADTSESFIFTWHWMKNHPMRVIPYSGLFAALGCILNSIFICNIFDSK